jgi:hypothetical protein
MKIKLLKNCSLARVSFQQFSSLLFFFLISFSTIPLSVLTFLTPSPPTPFAWGLFRPRILTITFSGLWGPFTPYLQVCSKDCEGPSVYPLRPFIREWLMSSPKSSDCGEIFEVEGQGGMPSCPFTVRAKWYTIACLNLEVSSSVFAAVYFKKV